MGFAETRATPADARPAHMTACERWALALLAIGTAVFLPLALNRFVFPKLAVVTLGILLATLVPARGRLPGLVLALLAAAAAVLLAAALTGATPLQQVLGRPPRYEGVFVLPVYLGALAAGARLLGTGRARGATAWFLRWLSVASIAIGIEAVLEATGLRPLASNVSRPGSLLGNASDEGAWAVLALAPLGAVALTVGGRLYLSGALAAAATLICSGSRGALVGAAAAALVLFLLTPRAVLRWTIVAAVLAIALGVFALPATRVRVTGASSQAAETVIGRELLARETVRLVAAHPLLGVGPSGYLDAIPAYHDRRYERQVGPQNPPDSPHDWILQAAADGGVILALLAIVLVGLTIARGWSAVRMQATGGEAAAIAGVLAGTVGYGVALLFHFTSPGTTPLAALFAGALLAAPAASAGTRSTARVSTLVARIRHPLLRVVQLLLAALVVLFAAAAAAELPLRSAIDAVASDHLAQANSDFRLAHALRPWDDDIAATAGHAYVTLAADGFPNAAGVGAPWVAQELADYPHWTQALEDAALLDLELRRPLAAASVIRTALRGDPENPDLRTLAALARLRR